MFFTHKFRDPDTKRGVVEGNTEEMIFAYFWSQMQVTFPAFTGMTMSDIGETKAIIQVWVKDNFATANLTTLADFTSRLVDDYIENKTDREPDRG